MLINDLPLIKFVQIQTHSRCNANCVFCPYIESWHAKNPGTIPDELFDKILKDLVPFSFGINKGKFCPYLMQEPLIDRKIFERIRKIYKFFPNTCVEIATNGAILTDRIIENFINVFYGRRHEIYISHHGIDSYSLNKIMMIDYNKSINNIINLIKRSKGRLNIIIRGLGISFDGNICHFTSDQYHSHWSHIFKRENLNTKNVTVEFSKFIDRAGTIYRSERDANASRLGIIRKIDKDHPFYCDRIYHWIHIMYDGTIRICCMDYHAEVKLPNLNDISLIDYFRSDDYKHLVDMVTGNINSPDDFICKRCINLYA